MAIGPKLSRAQVEEMQRRHALYRANSPKRLMADYGVSHSVLKRYLRNEHRRPYA